MRRIRCILNNMHFIQYLARIAELEEQREFCRHDMQHLLDVCRGAQILNAEENAGIAGDMIYAAGLLHDIGRWQQYENGLDHAVASAILARPILEDCGFDEDEAESITAAIANHRREGQTEPLGAMLYKADKESRPCRDCSARIRCKRFL